MINNFFQFLMNTIFEPIILWIRHTQKVRALDAEARKMVIAAKQEIESGDTVMDLASEANFDIFAVNASSHYERGVKLYSLAAAKFAESEKLRLERRSKRNLKINSVPHTKSAKVALLKVRDNNRFGKYA